MSWIYDLNPVPPPELEEFVQDQLHRLVESVDDNCCDALRWCEIGNADQEAIFARIEDGGCCGSVEEEAEFEGRTYRFGLNYGH